jgi:hypothetical protein
MNKDAVWDTHNVIRLAKEAGASPDGKLWLMYTEDLEAFAKLVAEHEREACAKVCDDIDAEYEGEDVLATWCSQAIRAMGQA